MLQAIVENRNYLNGQVQGYFHAKYYTMNDPRNANIKFVNFLKNDFQNFSHLVPASEQMLTATVIGDLQEIVARHGRMLACGIPRSKRENSYPASKMGLKRGIRAAIAQVPGLEDGMDCIIRHTNTCTTHWARYNKGGDGRLPYPGITHDTCIISPLVAGKNILLIDDIYTPNCGIDEDAIQALVNAGARSVVFYAIGYTVKKDYRFCA